jgi:hypothetical protein
MKFTFSLPLIPTLLAFGSISVALAQPPASPPESVPEPTAVNRNNVERRNKQTGLGLKKSSSSDSKIAKNVLESTGEGYCSVCRRFYAYL